VDRIQIAEVTLQLGGSLTYRIRKRNTFVHNYICLIKLPLHVSAYIGHLQALRVENVSHFVYGIPEDGLCRPKHVV
jgi:hypothetical protein